MPIPPKYDSLSYKLNELKRKAEYLDTEVTWQALSEFALVGYHLCDWIEEDASLSQRVRDEAKAFRDKIEVQACRDLANTHKHRKLTKPSKKHPPQVKDQDVQQGWGVGRWGKGGFGIGEEEIRITMIDGTEFDAQELAAKTVKLWEDFFARHNLR